MNDVMCYFYAGLIGAFAPELLRWRKLLESGRKRPKAKQIKLMLFSVVYSVIGGLLATLLADSVPAAVYIGCSWPAFLSVFAANARRGRGTEKCHMRFRAVNDDSVDNNKSAGNCWSDFDEALL
ncbi:MAG: hypothetical protein WCS89_02430 [Candidatus Paceibacterota bacterium]|jgi:hypothetical protein